MGTVKYTGPVASFHCPTNAEIRSLKVHFSPKQEGSGDPSPENVREIVGWDGVVVEQSGENQSSTTDYEFGVLGKNKFDPNCEMWNYSVYTKNGDQITQSGSDGRGWTNSNFSSISLKAGIYTITCSDGNNINIRTSIDNFETNISLPNGGGTFTLAQDCNVKIKHAIKSGNSYPTTFTIQLELGSTATTYVPYNPNKTVYGGWVDLITGEVEEEYGIFETTWGAMGNADVRGSYERRELNVSSIGFIGASAGNLNNRSDRRFCNIAPWRWDYYGDQLHYYADMGSAFVFLPINSDDNITIRIVCYLATPITYHIAPSSLQTFLGQNNVWSNADYVEVEYDLHETQDILARKQFIVANQPHIVKPAAAPLQNFTTDVPAPLKECKVHFGPVQDLHGYDKPWPAGGGKNIAKPYDNSYVSSTYISFDYSAANGTFRCYGTASASSTHSSPSATNAANNGATFTLPAGTYTLSIIDGDGANIYAQCVSSTETVLAETTSYTTFTTSEALTVFVRLKVAAGATVDNTVKIQLEAGSTATSYVPYENVCPISGWTGCDIYQARKNLVSQSDIVTSKYVRAGNTTNYPLGSETVDSNWSCTNYIKVFPNTIYTVSVPKFQGATSAGLVFYSNTIIESAISGVTTYVQNSAVYTFTTPSNCHYLRFSWNNKNGNEVLLELGSTAAAYEPYTGTTIPITFPATTNLFNEQWEQGNIEVGNDAGSSTAMRTGFINVNPSTSYYLYTSRENNVFVFEYLEDGTYADKVNGMHTSHTFTTGSTTKKIRIVDRNSGTETVNTGINYPATITYYEPYGTIYGGYVDLVSGEVWQTWNYVALDTLRWESFGGAGVFYNSSIRRKAGNPIYSNILTPTTTAGTNYASLQPTQIYYYKTNTTYKNYLMTRNTDFSGNLNGYRQWMKDTYPGAVAFYELETPVLLTTLTPAQLKTLRGTNNIWANNNGGNIEVAYWRH